MKAQKVPVAAHLGLQRKCACGQHTIGGGECASCREQRAYGDLKRAANQAELVNEKSPIIHRSERSLGKLLGSPSRSLLQSRFEQDFSHVRLQTEPQVLDRDADEEGTQPSVNPVQKETIGGEAPDQEASPGAQGDLERGLTPLDSGGGGGSGSGSKPTCPTKTVVEKLTNKTADGKKYRTGMGAVATIKVEPDKQNWDGTGIVESFPKPLTSDCPKEFGISPCGGSSTFIVGAKRDSPVFGALAATSNRFYDFHETRWKGGSLLHDRNPGGIASCKISCEQNYSCGGAVIGTHTITRTFTKGKVDSVDVTFVNVSKT